MSLALLAQKIEEKRSEVSPNEQTNLNWLDYEFGKNFCLAVKRDQEQTECEVDFIIDKLRLKPGAKILDLGCGDGRISLPLAERGYRVTGIDLNLYAIEKARKAAQEKNVEINFIHGDILDLPSEKDFNAVILIFNHFGIFNPSESKKLLKNIYDLLELEGKVLIETSSVNQGISQNGTQEWKFQDSWLAGNFPQLVLTENYFFEKESILIRKDFCLALEKLILEDFTQKTYLYDLDTINQILKLSSLKLIQTFGDWDGNLFDSDNDENIIFIARK